MTIARTPSSEKSTLLVAPTTTDSNPREDIHALKSTQLGIPCTNHRHFSEPHKNGLFKCNVLYFPFRRNKFCLHLHDKSGFLHDFLADHPDKIKYIPCLCVPIVHNKVCVHI